MPAELLGDGLDLVGGDPLHVHFGQCADESLLGALAALKERRQELAVTASRHAQL